LKDIPNRPTNISVNKIGNIYAAGAFNGTIDLDPSITSSYNLGSSTTEII
jgi:hypothetical protein